MLYKYLGRREESKGSFCSWCHKAQEELSPMRKNFRMEMHSTASVHHNCRIRGGLQRHLQIVSFLKPVCFQPGDSERASLR